jgi:hypothetical protein
MTTPIRFQSRRTKGFRKPEGGFVAGRRSHLGNVYTVEEFGHAGAVERHKADALADCLRSPLDGRHVSHDYIRRYRGRPFGCPACRLDQACHCDVLLELANR